MSAPRVAVVGAGITDCRGRHYDRNLWDLAQMGTAAAVKDAGIHIADVPAAVVGLYNDIFAYQAIPENCFTGMIGMANKRLTRVSNGGATGMHALQVAYEMVASREYPMVLCLGVEKATDPYDFQAQSPTPQVVQTIAWSWDQHFERPLGATASDSYAQVILAYMDEHPGDLDPMVRAQIVELLCQQAQTNPHAQRLGEKVTADDVLRSRYVVYPNRLLETCVYTEGAGAVILAADGLAQEICQQNGSRPLWITGRGFAHEPYFPGNNIDRHKVLHRIYSDYLGAKQAFEMAGLTPKDIGIFELHDAFAAQLMITVAEFGFVPLGQANKTLDLMTKGEPFINMSGGLIFGGHFVGGSNMFSLWSCRREMLKRGIANGMIHGTGASLAQYTGAWILQQD